MSISNGASATRSRPRPVSPVGERGRLPSERNSFHGLSGSAAQIRSEASPRKRPPAGGGSTASGEISDGLPGHDRPGGAIPGGGGGSDSACMAVGWISDRE